MAPGKTNTDQQALRGVFDREAALARLGNDASLLAEMVEFFLNDAPELIRQVREGLAKGDAKQMERAAHSLKGMASMFDAGRTVAAAMVVEELGRAGEVSQAGAAVEQLEGEVDHLVRAMRPEKRKS